jgi:hypothetical protein
MPAFFFRYDTEVLGGKFCVPSKEALSSPAAEGV